MHSEGFRPVANVESRVLILGTLPGPRSLEQHQYYAQPRNAFWPIMGRLFGAEPTMLYGQRLQMLKGARVALWDVCHSAYRAGALDAAIRRDSIVPNDLRGFLRSHRQIRTICFNGQTAADLFRRLVVPELTGPILAIHRVVLPSTSPAFAAMPFDRKLEQWESTLRAALAGDG